MHYNPGGECRSAKGKKLYVLERGGETLQKEGEMLARGRGDENYNKKTLISGKSLSPDNLEGVKSDALKGPIFRQGKVTYGSRTGGALIFLGPCKRGNMVVEEGKRTCRQGEKQKNLTQDELSHCAGRGRHHVK